MDKKVWKQWWFKIALLVIPVLLYYLVPAFQEIIQNAVKVLSRVDVDAARIYPVFWYMGAGGILFPDGVSIIGRTFTGFL